MDITPQEPHFNQNRSDAIERLLSDTVEATTRPRPMRRTLGIGVGAAVVAFAVAGALTGAAVASATAAPNAHQQAIDRADQSAGYRWVVEEDYRPFGQPFTASGTGTISVNLGQRPAGANSIVEASDCATPGTFDEGVDGHLTSQTICDSTDTGIGNIGTSSYTVTSNGSHTFTFTTTPGAHYSIWLSWIYAPTLSPSPAEREAVADGTVTRDEYVAAFNQYLGCMAAAGYSVTGYNESAPVIQYSNSDAAVSSGTENRCYQTQFRLVDGLWQTENGGINSK